MAESDPKIAPQDWFAVRKRNARAGLRKLVAIVAENRTDRAEAPLPLHADPNAALSQSHFRPAVG